MYLVFEDGSRQYRVTVGDMVRIDLRQEEVEVGAYLELDRILLLNTDDDVLVGTPLVEGAKALVRVVGHPSTKTYIQKMRRRKGYRRFKGHRQHFIEVRVLALLSPGQEAPPEEELENLFEEIVENEEQAKEEARLARLAAREEAEAPAFDHDHDDEEEDEDFEDDMEDEGPDLETLDKTETPDIPLEQSEDEDEEDEDEDEEEGPDLEALEKSETPEIPLEKEEEKPEEQETPDKTETEADDKKEEAQAETKEDSSSESKEENPGSSGEDKKD